MDSEQKSHDREWQREWLLARIEEEAGDMMEQVRLQEAGDKEYNAYERAFREGLMRGYARTAVQFDLVDLEMMHGLLKQLTGQEDLDLELGP